MTATAIVTKLHASSKASRTATQRRPNKALRRQTASAVFVGLVAVALTGLSLSHLAHGVKIVTGSSPLESWAMAVGIDLAFIAIELSQLTATTERLRKTIATYTKPAVAGTLAGSAAMNAFAFAALTSGWMMYAAIALGVAIPALIYAMTRIGAALYIDCHSKS
jgi:hypothetical protein